MSSVVNKELQAILTLQAKVKEVFNEEILKTSSFAKELYKQVRNSSKKLDDVLNIEAKLKQKGVKVTEEQLDKVKNKDGYIQTIKISIEIFELYKRTDFAEAQKLEAEREAAAAAEAAANAAKAADEALEDAKTQETTNAGTEEKRA
jgi:hypothetical protein